MLYWLIKYVFVGPLLRVLYRPEVEGLEHVPADGRVILAINHNSFMDSIFLSLMVKRHVTFLAKDEYFTSPGIRGFLMKTFFTAVGQVPIDRTGGTASEAALRTGARVLNTDAVLGIYPEGTRSPDGKLYRGHTGVGRMALAANAKVIPVAMIGTRDVQPAGKTIPKVRKIGIKIGAPLDFTRYEGLDNDRFVLRSMTDEIMYEIMQLSGQEYSDMYAKKAKKLLSEQQETGTPIISAPPADTPDNPDTPDNESAVA